MMIKKIVLGVVALIVIMLIWQHELVGYGIGQARGQFAILYNARPVEEYLNNPQYPDSLKQKLLLIQEIRRFAVDSLGINDSENYTTMYDQQGKPVLWTVTASEPYELKPVEWKFPFLGSFSYKGFFDYAKAEKEEAILKAQGYDTGIDEIAGWSTLGWFKDPILSNMLDRNEGQLANLIIHELTHGTLYVKNNVEYNENLASFVGDYGAQRFLEYKYGRDSKEYQVYEDSKYNKELYSKHILRGALQLDSLYKSFQPTYSIEYKDQLKNNFIQEIMQSADTLSFAGKRKKRIVSSAEPLPNNTYFMGFIRYRAQQNLFEEEFRTKFDSDFQKYFAYLKDTYPSL